MGTGKNGTFDKVPDLSQWAILITYEGNLTVKAQFGNFIVKWFDLFCNCKSSIWKLHCKMV